MLLIGLLTSCDTCSSVYVEEKNSFQTAAERRHPHPRRLFEVTPGNSALGTLSPLLCSGSDRPPGTAWSSPLLVSKPLSGDLAHRRCPVILFLNDWNSDQTVREDYVTQSTHQNLSRLKAAQLTGKPSAGFRAADKSFPVLFCHEW